MERSSAAAAPREPQLDRLKAIAIVFVVVWHLHPVYVEHALLVERIVRFFDFEVSLVAVPVFLTVSLRLFYPKADEGAARVARRLWRLATLFLFWTAVQTAIAMAISGPPRWSLQMVRLGGPELPIIGASVFYYLFDLLVLTLLAWGYSRLPGIARAATGAAIVAGSLAHFEWSLVRHETIQYYELQNFIPYVPVAFYLRQLIRYRAAFILLYLSFAIHDQWLGNPMDCAYGRNTVFFGALALVTTLLARPAETGRATRLLAGYSLGIYAVHKYWQYLAMVVKGGRSLNLHVGGATVHAAALLIFLATAILTAASVALLARTGLRRFVA